MSETENKPKCTCPCIDCIEGNHCGGEYWWPPEPVENPDGSVEEPVLVGKCEHVTDEQWHEMGVIVEGCTCSRCRPDLYEDEDEYEVDEP